MSTASRGRVVPAGVALALSAATFGACTEVESSSPEGYAPSKLEAIRGSDAKRVVLTREGARRIRLETGTVTARGRRTLVPAAAVLYDATGGTWVYASPAPRTFVRAAVRVHDVRGARAVLTAGPPPGTAVVTTGAAEVHGAELEIAGGH